MKKWNSSNITAYNLENDELKLREDPPVISKYKALRQILDVATPVLSNGKPDTAVENVYLNTTFGNSTTLFANPQINRDLNISNPTVPNAYNDIRTLYINGALDIVSNPVMGIGYLAYKEQVYPSAINMYSRRNRERVGYKNTFWKNSRTARTTLGEEKFGGANSQGYVVSQSAWALDTSEQFGTGLSTYIAHNASLGAAGELQNDYTFAFRLIGGTTGDTDRIRPSPILSRKHMMGSKYSVIEPFTIQLFYKATFPFTGPRNTLSGSLYLSAEEIDGNSWPTVSTYNTVGHVSIFGGNAKFEAAEQAGYVEDGIFISSPSTPFYDKYDLYVQNMRLKNKDMSLIPEFRISENVAKYIEDSNGFLAQNTASFSIFGITQNNTETVTYTQDDGNIETYDIQTSEVTPQNSSENDFYKIYSFSDFMENFNIISKDHDDFDMEKGITLSCKALKKFIAYDGFYPAERTLQMSKYLKEDYAGSIKGESLDKNFPLLGTVETEPKDNNKLRPFYSTLISPGILFNTIKSGIAVDYPIYTGSYDIVQYSNSAGVAGTASDYSDYYAIGTASNNIDRWHYRVPFEAILNPDILNGKKLMDMEPHPSSSLSIYSQLSSQFSLPKRQSNYKLSIDNFLSETVNFFLQDSKLTTLESKQESEFVSTAVETGQTYGLRIKLKKSMIGEKAAATDYPVPQEYFSSDSVLNGTGINDRGGVNSKYRISTLNMYSRPTAFGPPLAGTGSFNGPVDGATIAGTSPTITFSDSPVYDGLFGYNVSHTPPYYNGEAWVDVLYTAASSGKLSLDDIFASSSVISWRIDGESNDIWPSGDDDTYPMHRSKVNNYAMQITSSVNIFKKKFKTSPENPLTKSPVWAIQTKFETPILNFSPYAKNNFESVTKNYLTDITVPSDAGDPWDGYDGKTTTPLGIWHQFGLIPKSDEGIYLEIDDISPEWLSNRATKIDIAGQYSSGDILSLKDIVGFGNQSEKIGKLSEGKTFFEAVVAVPFVDVQSISKTRDKQLKPNQTSRNFFELPTTQTYSGALNEIMSGGDSTIRDLFPSKTDQSIIEMSEKIKDKYVFPPEFDFFRNPKAKPLAMYIFDFEHTFDKNDLSYIWQNIAPKLGNEFQEAISSISHPLLTETNLMEDLKDKVKWMVFKVKQRASVVYNNNILGGIPSANPTYSYNWPYDYFSMIEFAKIDSSITYGSIPEATKKITSPQSTTGLPPSKSTDIAIGNTTTTAESRQSELATDSLVQSNIKTLEREND